MKLFGTIYPALFWLAVIWMLSSLPTTSLPSIQIMGFDKLAHMGVYFILGLLCNLWLKRKSFTGVQTLFFYSVLILLATADEAHQAFIPGRDVSGYDLLANTLGLVLAACLPRLIRKLVKPR